MIIKDIEYLVIDLTKKLLELKDLKSWDGHLEMEAIAPMDCSVSIATVEAEIKKLIKDANRAIERGDT